jgi:hypothetical protein
VHANALPGPARHEQGFVQPGPPWDNAYANASPSPVRHAAVLVFIPAGSVKGREEAQGEDLNRAKSYIPNTISAATEHIPTGGGQNYLPVL